MQRLEKVRELARDLRMEEPRSAYDELGGEPYAARALDKCRAMLAGTNGEYEFGCPLDQHFFAETGIDMERFAEFVATGASDLEVGQWIREQARTRR
jgi:hypothetical protein